jgi:hypothetical protein
MVGNEPAISKNLPTILPLPFRRGEGRGEGPSSIFHPLSSFAAPPYLGPHFVAFKNASKSANSCLLNC